MSYENPFQKPEPVPEKNELPLRIKESMGYEHQGRESAMWQATVADSEGQERLIALKQARREEFANPDVLRKSKEFYDFLKSFPHFAKFVPETLFFVARETKDDAPHAYRLQKMFEGKQIGSMTDEEIAKDPAMVRELIELIDASTEVFEEALKTDKPLPDYYGSTFIANYLPAVYHRTEYTV